MELRRCNTPLGALGDPARGQPRHAAQRVAMRSPRSAMLASAVSPRGVGGKTSPRKSPTPLTQPGRPLRDSNALRDSNGRHAPTTAARRQPPTAVKVLSWREATGPADAGVTAVVVGAQCPPSPPRAASWEPELQTQGQPEREEAPPLRQVQAYSEMEQVYLEKERQGLEEARRHEEETEQLVRQRMWYEQERLRLQQQLLEEERQRIEEQRQHLHMERQLLEEERSQMMEHSHGRSIVSVRSDSDAHGDAKDHLVREDTDARLRRHKEAKRRAQEAAQHEARQRQQEREERARAQQEQQRVMPRWTHQHPFALCPRRSGGGPPPRSVHSQRSGSPDPVNVWLAGRQKGTFFKEVSSPRTTTPCRSQSLQRLCEGLPVSPRGSFAPSPRGSYAPSRTMSFEPRPMSMTQSPSQISRLSSYEPSSFVESQRGAAIPAAFALVGPPLPGERPPLPGERVR